MESGVAVKWGVALSAVPVVGVAALAAYDLVQKPHALLRNYPVLGHLRYLLEEIGPELRQYIVSSNDEERPFSRNQRRWIYASSKLQNNYYGFGTDTPQFAVPAGYAAVAHEPVRQSLQTVTMAVNYRFHPAATAGGE